MKLFGKDLDREVAIIAEIGVNHEGDPDTALKLLHLAAETGVDAVKFQTYTPERFASASDPDRLERVTRFSLDEATLRTLAAEAPGLGVHIFSTAVTEDVMPLLDELFPVLKIASGDLTFEPVIRVAAKTGKPVILSTGLGTMEEIEAAICWVRDEVGEAQLRDRLVLMHCVSAYPTPIEEANVLSVPFLTEKTRLRVGYSNHVIGPEACLAAVALGACMIEVHFTDCKTGREFRDHALSFEPDDMQHLIESAGKVRSSLGRFGKQPMECELENLAAVRKGVVAARDLIEGTVLDDADLMYARPAHEFCAAERPQLIGKTLLHSKGRGETIKRKEIGNA
jgi:N-acetylneuraminate synthase/N,N'-diacetyllegionaminate synthase